MLRTVPGTVRPSVAGPGGRVWNPAYYGPGMEIEKNRARTAGLDLKPNWERWLSAIGDNVVDQSGGGDILDPNPNGFKHSSCRALGGLKSPEHLSRFCEDRGL